MPLKSTQKKRSHLRRLKNSTGRWLGVRFGSAAIRRIGQSCKKVELGAEHRQALESQQEPVILALWHGRGVLAAPFNPISSTTVLVSASEDGSMATTILGQLGYEIIRGSSSRHGVRALRQMMSCLSAGKSIAITPDGPRGPMHSMSPGVSFLARATGAAVLPMGLAYEDGWHLDTWDSYTIPKPMTKIVVSYGAPVRVPRETSGEALQEFSSLVRTRLRTAEREGFAALGKEPDWEGIVPDEELSYSPEVQS